LNLTIQDLNTMFKMLYEQSMLITHLSGQVEHYKTLCQDLKAKYNLPDDCNGENADASN
jgi:hypothetical protein